MSIACLEDVRLLRTPIRILLIDVVRKRTQRTLDFSIICTRINLHYSAIVLKVQGLKRKKSNKDKKHYLFCCVFFNDRIDECTNVLRYRMKFITSSLLETMIFYFRC